MSQEHTTEAAPHLSSVDWFNYQRRSTHQIKVGSLTLGGDAPLRIQSMTTADTMDIEKTVAESERMIDAGCELVRITAPSKKEAEALKTIAAALHEKGHDVPLVADIHFTPNAAEIAADHVEKIRVNPGNYADKKRFEDIEYTDASYAEELERIRERLPAGAEMQGSWPGHAHRNQPRFVVGPHHEPLRRHAKGMVESAMEFLRICRDNDYHNLVISMKASNPQVMVQAYRLLVASMDAEGMNYPLHLGVTEAGDGEDGRIKSAVGIGALLEDGLGDTIRVSLTEAPEAELPVARMLVERYDNRPQTELPAVPLSFDPYSYARRSAREAAGAGGKQVPRVVHDLSGGPVTEAKLFGCGYRYSVPLDKWNLDDFACDFIYTGAEPVAFELPGTLAVLQDAEHWQDRTRHYPVWQAADWAKPSRRVAFCAGAGGRSHGCIHRARTAKQPSGADFGSGHRTRDA